MGEIEVTTAAYKLQSLSHILMKFNFQKIVTKDLENLFVHEFDNKVILIQKSIRNILINITAQRNDFEKFI